MARRENTGLLLVIIYSYCSDWRHPVGQRSSDPPHFWTSTCVVALAAKILMNAAAGVNVWMKYNSLQEQKAWVFILHYRAIHNHFATGFCYYQNIFIYSAVSLPSRQLNTLWSSYLEYMPLTTVTVLYRGKYIITLIKQLSPVIITLERKSKSDISILNSKLYHY